MSAPGDNQLDAVAAAPRVSHTTVGVFEENCYLVVDPATDAAIVVDPGAEGGRIVRMVRDSGARLEAIWLTHAHLDHIGAIADVKREWDVPVYLHPDDLPVFDYAPRAAQMYWLPWTEQPRPERELADGMELTLGTLRFTVMHTPGHAPGHVVFHGHGVVLGGDLLFAGSIGRTDLPLSDPRAMSRSLARIATLPEDAVVYPGHGPATTIGDEVATNPFLNGGARVLGG
ncbi:beta-lactamase domain protein [Gemmatirosa kalamazoonensis]|uniref:Beta-lactamase domain protein n=1 Tax=Gemmatirosa kalamazoonensis TaxID=861299 RepID=W0RK20_9BACT|nr:MBL fold metallo-hydrolase [Gemmatirosa kalamazoonensis]AHG91126.1 beta-lactamase domain protein [Gemmatirosa kalamazoonensis]